jgi:triosephosphate isomerase (TIM)
VTRTSLIAGNWKMNLDHLEAIHLVQQLAYDLRPEDYQAAEIVVVPPFTALRSIQTLIEGDKLALGLGAQNCHFQDAGAYTGEVSAPMLARLKVRYVICGHSERRQLFGEDDAIVNRKVLAVLRNGMTPILCVGETLEQREAGEAKDVVVGQLRACMAGVASEAVGAMVIAYEPVWAIGTGRNALPEEAQEMCALVRATVAEVFTGDAAEGVRVQYGGSVKAGNASSLLSQPDIDGALVGGASLDPRDFAAVCRASRL